MDGNIQAYPTPEMFVAISTVQPPPELNLATDETDFIVSLFSGSQTLYLYYSADNSPNSYSVNASQTGSAPLTFSGVAAVGYWFADVDGTLTQPGSNSSNLVEIAMLTLTFDGIQTATVSGYLVTPQVMYLYRSDDGGMTWAQYTMNADPPPPSTDFNIQDSGLFFADIDGTLTAPGPYSSNVITV